ncbi:unnamed protein product, partial [Diamesa serratosioi]
TWSMMSGVLNLRKAIEELTRRIRERHDGFCSFSITPNDELVKIIENETWTSMEDYIKFLVPLNVDDYESFK